MTSSTSAALGGKAFAGGIPVVVIPMARDGSTGHVRRIAGGGIGAWVSLAVVVGRSGSGKSTLLILLGGWSEPDAGTIVGVTSRAWADCAYVPQRFGLVPDLTVAENVELPAKAGTSAELVWAALTDTAAAGTACFVATHEPDARLRADVSWEIESGRVARD